MALLKVLLAVTAVSAFPTAETLILPGSDDCLEFMGISEIEALAKNRVTKSVDFHFKEHQSEADNVDDRIHDTNSICEGFCKSILLHKNQYHLAHRLHASVDRLEHERQCIVDGRSTKDTKEDCKTGILDYCNKRMCPAFNEACDLILKREMCVVKMAHSDPISMDCFVHIHVYQDMIGNLTPEKVRRKVDSAGLHAYNAEALRQQKHCREVGIPEKECSFDYGFEVDMRKHLKGWYATRAHDACIRANERSPVWMTPKLNCGLCTNSGLHEQQECLDNVMARQMRLSYHVVRFLELIDLYHHDWGQDIGAYEWIVAKADFAPNKDQSTCFAHFFTHKQKMMKDDFDDDLEFGALTPMLARKIPETRCFEALADMLAGCASIENGAWIRENVALKLFKAFFVPDNDEALPMTSDVTVGDIYNTLEQVQIDIYRQQAEDKLQVQRDHEDGEKSADEAITDEHMMTILNFIKTLGTELQEVVPFSYEDDFSRQALYYTHDFLHRATKTDQPYPGLGDVEVLLAQASKSLQSLRERFEEIEEEFKIDVKAAGDKANLKNIARTKRVAECEVAFFDKFAMGRALIRAARKLDNLHDKEKFLHKFEFDPKNFKACAPEDDTVGPYKKMFGTILGADGLAAQLKRGLPAKSLDGLQLKDHLRDYVLGIAKARLFDVLDEILGKLGEGFQRSKQRAPLSSSAHLNPRTLDEAGADAATAKATPEDMTEDMSKRLVEYSFEWHEYLRDSEKWPLAFFSELNDAGLAYRRLEMQRIRHLCKIFRIDPDVTYFPLDNADEESREVGQNFAGYDTLSGNYDKQECSIQHVIARQYALRGLLEYDDGAHHKDIVEHAQKPSNSYRIWPTEAIANDEEAVALDDPVMADVRDALKTLDLPQTQNETTAMEQTA